MPKSSLVVWRHRRFPSLFAAIALLTMVAACDSSTGDDGDIASLSVNPEAPTLNIGSSQQLVATPLTNGGRILERAASWSTSNAAVATVDANGLVMAVGGGTADITATVGGLSDAATITVWHPVQSVTVAVAAGNLQTIRQEGATQLVPTILDMQGAAAPTRQLLWTTSDANIATVSTGGRVSARSTDGTATITATSLVGGVQGSIVITVSGPPEVGTVTTYPQASLLGVGQTFQVADTLRAASGTVITAVDATWASLDAGVATVDGNGLVTGVSAGTARITATAEGKADTTTFTVLPHLAEGASAIPTTSDAGASGGILDYALHLPDSIASFEVSTTATGGDIDLYVFAPGVTPGNFAGSTFSGFLCRPWLVGPTESCSIDEPVAGIYRIRVHAFPGGGSVTGGTITLTVTPEP